ncbi:MAG: DUF4440 domain-containing protein [Bacteroidota bacterium]
MKTKKFLIVCVLAIISAFYINQSSAQTKSGLAEAQKAIVASNGIYFSSFIKNDANIFADRYAEDCIILAPNSQSFKGRKGALEFFKLGYDAGLRNGKFITEDVYGDGVEYVTEQGQWQSIDDKGKVTDDGKFLVLWKKTAKGWKMFRDSFSSNHPAAK